MKRLIGVICVLSMLICACSLNGEAFEKNSLTRYPVVIVPGYSSSQLYYNDAQGAKKQVWWIGSDIIQAKVFDNIAEIGKGLGMLTAGKAEYIAQTVGENMVDLFGKLACNDDGTSKYNLKLYYTSAEETCSANLMKKYSDGSFRHEIEIMAEVAKYTGNKNIFNFNCDFRMSVADCAKKLDTYIQDVLRYTDSNKVNIIAVSHGGQITAAYLTKYGYKRQVDNAVLNVPAIGGAGLAYDVFAGDFDFDEEELLRYFEYGMMEETDYHWLLKAGQLGFLDDILNAVQPYVIEFLGNWESVWDLIPAKYYDAIKEKYLDETKNAALIASSDYMHYKLMPLFSKSLQRCNDKYGMNVSIIAGTDNAVLTGLKENSDGIITVAASTGATAAPFGKRFPDGCKAINGKNGYISPAKTIDASTAYLPYNTWFVEGLFHGMEYKDPYSASLLIKLLLTDEIKSVYSDPAYPRLHATTNVSASVFGAFDKSKEGYIGPGDTALKITNLSKKYPMVIIAVNSGDLNIRFKPKELIVLKPGEQTGIDFTRVLPAAVRKYCSVTVVFALLGSPTPVNERILNFTVNNSGTALAK